MKQTKVKRISFDEHEAPVIYEWWLALEQGLGKDAPEIAACGSCIATKKRLEIFLGKKHVASIKRLVKIHPYFPKKTK